MRLDLAEFGFKGAGWSSGCRLEIRGIGRWRHSSVYVGGYEPRGGTSRPYIVRIINRSKNRLGGDFS
jgi:hypothetical protein